RTLTTQLQIFGVSLPKDASRKQIRACIASAGAIENFGRHAKSGYPPYEAAHRRKADPRVDGEGMTSLHPGAPLPTYAVLAMVHGITARQFRAAQHLKDKHKAATQEQAKRLVGLK
ncbi:unnamed protein product, partial [Ectocarpus fasciculatus]